MDNERKRNTVSTGDAKLDRILRGGIPENRSVLVVGGPGTGKSTLGMQFLQEGLREGEKCVFLSTEQTPAELRDSFAPYAFDLDHEDLTLATIHARPGYTLDDDEECLTVETLDGHHPVGEGYAAPFSAKYVTQLVGRYAPADRVVIDSVSGLRAMSSDREAFRRAVLDLVRLVTDEFEATGLLVAESRRGVGRTSAVEPLEYNTHGVIRLWREREVSRYRRYVDVMKMRGVDHDERSYELTFGDGGVEVIPHRRALSAGVRQQEWLGTGVEELDDLLGGGLQRGDSVLLEHDGRANVDTLLFAVATTALDAGMDTVLLPRVNTSPRRIDDLVARADVDFDSGRELLDADRLFVLDALGAWERHENVYDFRADDGEIEDRLREIRETAGGDGLFLALNTEAKVHVLGKGQVRRVRYWLQSAFLEPDDVLFDIHNPKVMASRMAEFYTDAASQVVRTWLDDNGFQYIRLEKAVTGDVGGLRLVEYVDDEPFVRLR